MLYTSGLSKREIVDKKDDVLEVLKHIFNNAPQLRT